MCRRSTVRVRGGWRRGKACGRRTIEDWAELVVGRAETERAVASAARRGMKRMVGVGGCWMGGRAEVCGVCDGLLRVAEIPGCMPKCQKESSMVRR